MLTMITYTPSTYPQHKLQNPARHEVHTSAPSINIHRGTKLPKSSHLRIGSISYHLSQISTYSPGATASAALLRPTATRLPPPTTPFRGSPPLSQTVTPTPVSLPCYLYICYKELVMAPPFRLFCSPTVRTRPSLGTIKPMLHSTSLKPLVTWRVP